MTHVKYIEDGDVGRITLARPPLNVLDLPMLDELNAALESAAMHPTLKALVFAAEGEQFSTGFAVDDHLGVQARRMLDAFHGVFYRLRALDCVTLAAVRGQAMGGGAQLATFCDVVVAADDAMLGQPEITLGVFPTIAVLHYPARVGYARARRLILGGDVITAAEAERIGLVDRVVPSAMLVGAIEAELARYRRHSACVLRMTRRAMQGTCGLDFAEGLATLEELYQHELMTTADAEEGLRAFLEKRPPIWRDR